MQGNIKYHDTVSCRKTSIYLGTDSSRHKIILWQSTKGNETPNIQNDSTCCRWGLMKFITQRQVPSENMRTSDRMNSFLVNTFPLQPCTVSYRLIRNKTRSLSSVSAVFVELSKNPGTKKFQRSLDFLFPTTGATVLSGRSSLLSCQN
jgi:hypothetical protein